MNLALSFQKATSVWADNEAIVDGDKRFTYAQFATRVFQLISVLAAREISFGKTLAVVLPNTHEFMECYYAAALTGAILVPINYRLAAAEVRYILRNCASSLIIAHLDFADLVRECIDQQVKSVVWVGAGRCPEVAIESARYEYELSQGSQASGGIQNLKCEDLAQIYYTSGTTGISKGVMLTHGNVTFHALSAIAELGLSDADTWAHIAPMFHLADAWATFAATWVGAKHVFVPYFRPADVLSTLEKEKVTLTNLVPTMINTLIHQPDVHNHCYSSLRLLLSGGAPIAPETVKKLVTTFGCDYVQTYGMTETSPYLTLSRLKASLKSLSQDEQMKFKSRTGRPFIGVNLKVVRQDGSEVEHNDQEVGEIIVSGPTVTPGYWRQAEATAEAIKDGWLYTGDLAVIDREGYVNIVDRRKDMIITGGENVYSTEVEHALHEHPGVIECAVFGVPSNEWGEAVHAAIVRKKDQPVDESELIAFVRERLAKYKCPRHIVFLDELPKTGSGKIIKQLLREAIKTSI